MGLGGAPVLIFKRSEGGYGAKAAVEVAFSDVEGVVELEIVEGMQAGFAVLGFFNKPNFVGPKKILVQ